MFERILIPVDGSPRAEAILRPLARLLGRRDADFIFLRVVEPMLGYEGVDVSALAARDRADAKAYFRDLSGRIPADRVRMTALVREGHPAELILREARERKATMIAMTTHGRTGLARWALGSVAEKVVRGADIPVLLARAGRAEQAGWTHAPAEETPFRRILLPTDGSEAAEAVFPAVAALAGEVQAQVAALHVAPAPSYAEFGGTPIGGTAAAAEKVAATLASKLADLKIKTRVIGAVGDPAGMILETAASIGADLIAMSTHGRTGLARLGFGSVAERVLREASVPMLIMKAAPAPAARKRARKATASA